MKVVSVLGARPQFVKASVVSPALRKRCDEVIVHTGQHYDYEMSEVFFRGLKIPSPDYNLECGSGGHGAQTGRIMQRLEPVLLKERPDFVLTYGDTNSTLAGALCAAKMLVATGHVEAGVRSWNRSMPEEVNRVVVDHVSSKLFCPTSRSVDNLALEGITTGVHLVGDVMYDSALRYGKGSRALRALGLRLKGYHLLTLHRPHNVDHKARLKSILDALSGYPVVFPAHPRTTKMMKRFGLKAPEGMKVIPPQGYVEMLELVRNASKVLTDSGGLQKEAYYFRVPCITLRDETEWVETVDDGWNVLAGSSKPKIILALERFSPSGRQHGKFGDGRAAEKIARLVCRAEGR
jgi:UDP-N-acetylglucosamine 2-epimerase